MEENKNKHCTCDVRNQLLQDVLSHGLEQAQNNLFRGGSCWGINANAALISLSQYLLAMHLLSKDFDSEEDAKRVKEFCMADFCVFTLETVRAPETTTEDIRREMHDLSQKLAQPVLTALKDTTIADTTLYLRLKSAVDGLDLMVKGNK